jgi:nitroimidazol reductase NimA-like FMN-containing flavoprotein (pyridoxamine 5'-phosphate oxidase superfamily)
VASTIGSHDRPMDVDRNGLEVLDRDACIRLLEQRAVGRVGVSSGALPTILPVNYWCDGSNIYIRTSPGTKLDAATRNAVIAFEVDQFDAIGHAGWSVVVTGLAREVTARGELEQLASAPLARWAPSDDGHIIAISLELVSGRRLRGGVAC